ncbi:MAG: hypothetical protein IJT58_06360 [Synergistaceae bacterium]|nr:hypothetical protein [Synergistaceae bacterium]
MRIEASEAKEKLYQLLGELEYDEEKVYIITHKDRPVAILGNYDYIPLPRKMGVAKGQFTVPDDFDDEDEEINKMFGVI